MHDGGGYCWLNGHFYRENETPVDARLFKTGIIVREEIRTRGTRIAFYPEHYEHLQSRLSIFKISLPDILTAEEMHQEAVRLINKNRYFGGNCLRISLIHDPGPPAVANHCLMECIPLDKSIYVLNRKGYTLGVYDDLNIPVNHLTGKFARSPLLDFFAMRYQASKGLDDCILLNQQGHIVESIYSSIFLMINNEIHTPPLKDGSSTSVMRSQMIRLFSDTGKPVNEKISLRILDIEKAEEIMLADALDGIRWVVAMARFRYFNHTGSEMIGLLNEKAFGKD